jgi:hypothetical protein
MFLHSHTPGNKALTFSEHAFVFYVLFFASAASFLTFILGVLLASTVILKLIQRGWISKSKQTNSYFGRANLITKAALLTSFAQVGYIPMMVWDYPREIVYTVSLFHLSSNVIASKVALQCKSYLPPFFVVLFGFACRTLCYQLITTQFA